MKNVILELTRIVQEAAQVDSPEDQVQKIVDSISQVVGTDVCSLYMSDENDDMLLLASHGLESGVQVKLEAGKGLVGLVAGSRHPINLAEAATHPNYYHIEAIGEEQYQSFCGVPLVRFGKVIGVLVVQSREARQLSVENEAFLVTLSYQLALLVEDIPRTIRLGNPVNLRIQGVKGSSGVGIGASLLCESDDLYSVADAPCEQPDQAIAEWHQLLREVQNDIRREQAALGKELAESVSSIFASYHSLLEDKALIEKVESEIRAGNCLPAALRKSIKFFDDMFRAMEDPYLQARHEDIHQLGNKLYNAWRGMDASSTSPIAGDSPVVLVGTQVSISDIAKVPVDQIQGIVCFAGSSMSHTAVLANALGIPSVMGVGKLKHLQNGEILVVDGNTGNLIRYPSEVVLSEFQSMVDEEIKLQSKLSSLRDLPAVTTDGTEIRLFTNSGLLADLSPGIKNGAQGIGLYRTEIPFMVRDSFPSEEEQIDVYTQVFEAYADKPVYMRTLDIGGDKQLPYFPITNEDNPALGWRGIRFSLDNVQLLMTQIRAMMRACGSHNNLNILLPMISSTQELDAFTELFEEALQQLREEGHNIQRPKVGVMVEVPAAISQLHFWAKKIDFISIGSNDLSQYLLALDRNNVRVAGRYDHIHPAVLQEIYRVIQIADRCNLPVSLCGEMASDPMAVMLLLGMGIRTLSMSANKLPGIKWLIRAITIDRSREILAQALSQDKVENIRRILKEEVETLKP